VIVITAFLDVHPRERDSVLAEMRRLVAESRKEDGCLDYAIAEDIERPNRFRIAERWSSSAALQRHLGEPHVRRFLLAFTPTAREAIKHEVSLAESLTVR
jgi:quinol monooxygenase YgiN